MIEKTSIKKFVIFEKQKVDQFPSAPVSLLLADVGESTDEEPDWNPVNYHEEVQPVCNWALFVETISSPGFSSRRRRSYCREVNSVIQSCQNDR